MTPKELYDKQVEGDARHCISFDDATTRSVAELADSLHQMGCGFGGAYEIAVEAIDLAVRCIIAADAFNSRTLPRNPLYAE